MSDDRVSDVVAGSPLTNQARALLFIACTPDARLRDIAAALDVTERTAQGRVADLTEAGFVLKERDGRRNSYTVQGDVPWRDPLTRERTIGDWLHFTLGSKRRRRRTPPG